MFTQLVLILLVLYCFLFIMTSASSNTLSFELTTITPPLHASAYVNPSFAGFGIEPSNLFSFTGTEEPNQLTFNLIDNLADYTGKPPHIRIGGNTADYMVFDNTQDEWAWILNKHAKGEGHFKPNHMIIGPRFFQAANRFPLGTPMTWGLNMAYDEPDWEVQIITMANQTITEVKNPDLVSFEMGNEPDLWVQNGFRSGQWTAKRYIAEWTTRAHAIWDKVLKPNNIPSNFFEGACTASTIGTDFQIKDLVGLDINRKVAGSGTSYLAGWNQHDYFYFVGVSSYTITLEYLMRLQTTEDQFTAWVEQVEQSKATHLPYSVREMGVVGPVGMAGISDVFGAALWTLNFLMYTASLGIYSVQFHMTDNSNASAWQPVVMYDREPFVRPLYSGIAAFDQIIGSSCSAQVSQTKITTHPPGYNDFIRVYNVYQNGLLDSLVIINGKMANMTEPNKARVDVSINVPPSLAGQKLHLSYLTSDGADASNGTIWNGISYEQSGDGTPTRVYNVDDIVQIGFDGSVTFSVRDTQAVVATIGRRVGELLKPNKSICQSTRNYPGQNAESNKGDDTDSLAAVTAPPIMTLLANIIAGAMLLIGDFAIW